jgi:hypothetical protein
MTAPPDIFWVADEPIKYQVRKTKGDDIWGPGAVIVRCEDSDENCQQAMMEIRYDGDTLRLVQIDGDLDAKKAIAADQDVLRSRGVSRNIWRRIWKVAMR